MTHHTQHVSRITQRLSRFAHHVSRIVHHDLALVLAVMTLARLLAIVALRPGGYVAETVPDSSTYFDLGRLSASGALPFVDYWTEYPPLFPWLSVLAHKISTVMPSWIDPRFWFNLALHALIVPFDALNLVLIYALSKRVSGVPFALKSAWLYATLFVPMFVVLGWFESIALFAVLLSLWLILEDRPVPAGIVIGLGMLVKPYVALMGAVGLIHLSTWRKVGVLLGAGLLTLLIGVGLLWVAGPQVVRANIDWMITRPAWSTPYALIDGVIAHVPPTMADRFDPALAPSPAAASQVPWGLVTLGFAIVYGFVLVRSYAQQHSRAAVGLAGFTFVTFLLWSKGYSPPLSLHMMAFLCILMPSLRGVLMLLALEALYVIEWPTTFILLRGDAGYLTALIVLRTLVMAGLGLLFGALIFVNRESGWRRLRLASMTGSLVGLLAVAGLAIGGLPLYVSQRYQAEPMREAIELIRSTSAPDRAAVLFDSVETYERLAAYLPGWPTLAALRIGGAADSWSDARIESFAAGWPEVWYVIDWAAQPQRGIGDALDRRLSELLCLVNRQFAGTARVSHYTGAEPTDALSVSAQFENGIQLKSAQISDTSIRAGDPICVALQWTATRTPSTDYTIFVHLLDPTGQVTAQSDSLPGSGFAPATTWLPSQVIPDRHGLITPAGAPPGTYRLTAGLYDPEGMRLPVRSPAGDSLLLGMVEILD